MKRHIPTMITVPAGRCPFVLEGTGRVEMLDWIKKIRDWAPEGVTYAPSALKYWIRHTYDINGEDYKIAASTLDNLLMT